MESKDCRFVVRANPFAFVLLIIFCISVSILCFNMMSPGEYGFSENGLGLIILSLAPYWYLCIREGLDYKNRRIIVSDEGLLFCDQFGRRSKIQFEEISAICSEAKSKGLTRVWIEVGGERKISFYSSDKNYDVMMEFLLNKVPDIFSFSHKA